MTRFADEAADHTFVLLRESGRAWLVRDEDDREWWLPKSICEFPPIGKCVPGATVEVTIPNWFAEKEGLLG